MPDPEPTPPPEPSQEGGKQTTIDPPPVKTDGAMDLGGDEDDEEES